MRFAKTGHKVLDKGKDMSDMAKSVCVGGGAFSFESVTFHRKNIFCLSFFV